MLHSDALSAFSGWWRLGKTSDPGTSVSVLAWTYVTPSSESWGRGQQEIGSHQSGRSIVQQEVRVIEDGKKSILQFRMWMGVVIC
jgi:hypothetical protein